ncbi:MAG: Fic family protein [Oscillospiraceae bacterium]|nr:Fic family protein [Oscillospiraceae bacterium]
MIPVLDTIQKLTYWAKSNIPNAAAALGERLYDRRELPLAGIHGERLYLTGVTKLEWRAAQLRTVYEQLPDCKNVTESILLDAWTSASIEGANVSLTQVKQHLGNPQTKDERMVVNAVRGSNYAYGRPITRKNLRPLWERVTEGVCENTHLDGKPYRSGMVEIGSVSRTIYTPATPERLPDLMEQWFRFREQDQSLIGSFVAHFYFVYVHTLCDGNGRTARIVNASSLYHAGWKKMKSLPLSNAIKNEINGHYRSLEDSETQLSDQTRK